MDRGPSTVGTLDVALLREAAETVDGVALVLAAHVTDASQCQGRRLRAAAAEVEAVAAQLDVVTGGVHR